ncbi:hypothetical protein PHMEG_0004688 [Phytophthora megakarya]|uniref:Uncharacterized protein n=1 Tax=Phytophthora megakarya TaxID=4795 RepID=A0A225WUV4_9STRA|nr:hypothetical protein PHMEG_0004688 [Phytophthora megakarya]
MPIRPLLSKVPSDPVFATRELYHWKEARYDIVQVCVNLTKFHSDKNQLQQVNAEEYAQREDCLLPIANKKRLERVVCFKKSIVIGSNAATKRFSMVFVETRSYLCTRGSNAE